MVDFFFDGWPNGLGPAIVQIGVAVAGAAAGIRLFDDVARVVAVVRRRRTSP
jgi:hypothetical protein